MMVNTTRYWCYHHVESNCQLKCLQIRHLLLFGRVSLLPGANSVFT